MRIKFPETKKELEDCFVKVLSSSLPNYLKSTHAYREEIATSRRYVAYAVFFLSTLVLSLYVLLGQIEPLVSLLLSVCLLIWFVIMFLSGRQWMKNDSILVKEMNMSLVPVFTNTLDIPLLFLHDEDYRELAKKELEAAGLLTVHDDVNIDANDVYIAYSEVDITFRELSVSLLSEPRKHFEGLLISAPTEVVKNFSLQIKIGDDNSSESSSLFAAAWAADGKSEEVKIELPDGVEKVQIFTDDKDAVLNFVTNEMLEMLCGWCKKVPCDVDIVLKDNHLYILVPNVSIKVKSTTTSVKLLVVRKAAEHILESLWSGVSIVRNVFLK